MRYARTLSRIFGRPLLIEQTAFEAMLPGFRHVLAGGVLPESELILTTARDRSRETGLRMEGGVAVIPVMGPLTHRGGIDAECRYLLGYQQLVSMAREVGDDPAAKAAVLWMDSPGGESSGCFEAAEMLPELLQGKPLYTAVDGLCCSAAYALAAGTKEIVATRTSTVGSIGVLLRHEDYSEMLKKEGIGVTLLYSGAHKADANPFEPLQKEVRADLQAEIDKLYGMFISHVAAAKPSLSEDDVRATEARVYMGDDAVSIGLADSIQTPDQLIARLAEGLSEDRSISTAFTTMSAQPQEDMTMSLPESITTALGLPADASESAALDAIQKARVDAGAQERKRIMGIIEHKEADGRVMAAVNLAKVEAMTPEAAGNVLAAMPMVTSKEGELKVDNQFAQMMNKLEPGQDVGAAGDDQGEDAETKAQMAAVERAFGLGESHTRRTHF